MKKRRSEQGIQLPFYKIHGAGNDMLVFEAKKLPLKAEAKAEFLRRMAHRQLGAGADQLLEILSKKPLGIQIWNQDGTMAEMCANGARSFLFLAEHEGWAKPNSKKRVPLMISGKAYEGLKTKLGFEICVGAPSVLGFDSVPVQGETVPFYEVSVGNPHAVILCAGEKDHWKLPRNFSFRHYGPLLENHKRFPKKTNVEFVRSMKLEAGVAVAEVEVWERGAGATLSCGSGAVAVARVLRQELKVDQVRILMNGFELRIRFEGDLAYLGGPSALVAKGIYFS
jgi:diaminopimelate epimerase